MSEQPRDEDAEEAAREAADLAQAFSDRTLGAVVRTLPGLPEGDEVAILGVLREGLAALQARPTKAAGGVGCLRPGPQSSNGERYSCRLPSNHNGAHEADAFRGETAIQPVVRWW